MGDNGDDDRPIGDDSRWMTYAELAQARGIKEPAAVRLVQRRGWERHQGNDGSARVAVPVAELRPSKPVAPAVTSVTPDSKAEALARERERADRAEAKAERAQADAVAARSEANQASREREEARVRAAGAEGEAKALREALDHARRPFWHRWLNRT